MKGRDDPAVQSYPIGSEVPPSTRGPTHSFFSFLTLRMHEMQEDFDNSVGCYVTGSLAEVLG